MTVRRRKDPRFNRGDTVQILSPIATRFDGMSGIVTDLHASRHAHTLDKYSVRFADTEDEAVFWDIQLKLVTGVMVVGARSSGKTMATNP
jgi:hypothetical protein